MSYRSDVRISTTKKGYNELRKFVLNYLHNNKREDGTEYPNLLENVDILKENNRQVYLGWNYCKWYEGDFGDVVAIMLGLDHLEEKDFSFSYARMGEEYGDYDSKSHYSKKDKEEDNYLEEPSVNWSFDDDYVIELMQKNYQVKEL